MRNAELFCFENLYDGLRFFLLRGTDCRGALPLAMTGRQISTYPHGISC